MFSDVAKYSKQRKTTKLIKLQWIASIWRQNVQNNSKLQTRSNYDQFVSIWRQNNQKHWGTFAKHSKQRKTTKLIKLQWIASIWCQNDPNNSKLQTRSNYDQFASIWRQNNKKHWGTVAKHSKQRKTTKLIKLQWIDIKTIQNVEIRRKTFKTTQTNESDQIIVHCIDLTSKRSKLLSYVAKHSKQRKPTKVIKL